ncbi:MAG TPA: YtxH domain-containing protein [Myxococcota bacterium]|nr:YtxH domain-containing protein [Myxococcota bacterium]
MGIKDIVDHLPPREDLVRLARYVGSLRRPARAELVMYGVAGALIGAGLALLFAPSRGSELRSQLGTRLEEYWRSANEYAANGHDRAEKS